MLALLTVVALFGLTSAGKNPCHENRGATGSGVTCNTVRIPRGLCDACTLDLENVDLNTGDFKKCDRIYKLKTTKCNRKLRHYVNANKHCDPVREKQVEDYFTNTKSLEALDYFMYSLCEQCCDCIPSGVNPTSYGSLKTRKGNCPAHAAYDICTVFPRIGRFIKGKVGPETPDPAVPQMCGKLFQWLGSPASAGWNDHLGVGASMEVPQDVRKFLFMHNSAAACKKRSIWEKCYEMEHRQNRV